jgi:HD-like signal output (HDOD) protein/ActR/RegA family two-component response regulator
MTRLLFVDDEPRVLDGLRQSLRGKRKVWDMVFASGGAAALQELERGPFDVVVSDMRMPGMDGATVLAKVASQQPQAVRMILSGQMEEASAARAAAVAHRFLAKPCDSETLVDTITRALELRALLSSDRMRECVGGMNKLPSIPRACELLNRALQQENAPLSSVIGIIQQDVAMSAKVLQLVNSAFFGMSRKISSLEQAVSYLGVSTLRGLVLANSLFDQLSGDDPERIEREQRYCTVVARFAQMLMGAGPAADTAFTAGLLHNVGGLALNCRLPEEATANTAHARARGIPLHEAELERLGVTHAGIGAYLLGLWGLPQEVIDAVAAHHAPWASFRTLDANLGVRLADALVESELGLAPEPVSAAIPAEVVQRFGLELQVQKLRAELPAALEREGASPT